MPWHDHHIRERLAQPLETPDGINLLLFQNLSSKLNGAHFVYGHTLLQRELGLGWGSAWAQKHFPGRRERNQFYTQVGYRVPPGMESLRKLQDAGSAAQPDEMMAAFVGAHGGAPSA